MLQTRSHLTRDSSSIHTDQSIRRRAVAREVFAVAKTALHAHACGLPVFTTALLASVPYAARVEGGNQPTAQLAQVQTHEALKETLDLLDAIGVKMRTQCHEQTPPLAS